MPTKKFSEVLRKRFDVDQGFMDEVIQRALTHWPEAREFYDPRQLADLAEKILFRSPEDRQKIMQDIGAAYQEIEHERIMRTRKETVKLLEAVVQSKERNPEPELALIHALSTWAETAGFREDLLQLKGYAKSILGRGGIWRRELERDFVEAFVEVLQLKKLEQAGEGWKFIASQTRHEAAPWKVFQIVREKKNERIVQIEVRGIEPDQEHLSDTVKEDRYLDVYGFITVHPEIAASLLQQESQLCEVSISPDMITAVQ